MPAYKYRAKDSSGKDIIGLIESINKDTAIDLLYNKNLFVIEINPHEKISERISDKISAILTINTKDLMIFSRQFSLLLRAGLTLTESLNVLAEQTNKKKFQNVIYSILKNVQKGESLSYSMRAFKKIFPPFYSSLIEVGEVTGNLDKIIERLASHYERIYKLKNDLKAAVTYPLFITITSLIIVSLVIVFIIPQFSEIFKKLGNYELPLLTLKLLIISNFLSKKSIYIFIFCAVTLFGGWKFRNSEKGHKIMDPLILKIPVFGEIIRNGIIANFAMSFSTMLASGVPILETISILFRISDNFLLKKVLNSTYSGLKEGDKLTLKISEGGFFPPLVIKMIGVGEESGNIDEMLNKIAEYFENEVETSIKTISSVIEPTLILLLGLFIGIIVIALYMPIFKVIQLL